MEFFLLNILIKIFTVVIGVWISYKLIFRNSKSFEKLKKYNTEKEIEDFLEKLIDSKPLFKIIRTALPVGKKDKDHGMDYIPFMVDQVQERRIRFKKSSNYYLTFTILLGIFIGVIITYFGNVLMNQDSIGAHKSLVQINNNLLSIERELNTILPSYYDNKKFTDICSSSIKELGSEIQFRKDTISNMINDQLNLVLTSENIVELENNLKEIRNNTSNLDKPNYFPLLDNVINDLSKFLKTQEAVIPELVTLSNQIKNHISQVSMVLNQPDNMISDIIKRLALSLIITTFFLAILRYLVSIYRDHYSEMIKAENEDLLIRKFYVAYKCSNDNPEQQLTSIKSLLKTSLEFLNEKSGDTKSPDTQKTLNELMDLIKKKI